MDQTDEIPRPSGPEPTPGPATDPAATVPPRPALGDLDGLRRSTTDRYVAGVAGGIGRHFNVDPTVIRVLLAVLAFFGGAGVLVYGVCWLFVPEDVDDRAIIGVGPEPRRLLIFSAAAIGVLLALGDAFSGFNAGWPIATVAVVIALVMVARERRQQPVQSPVGVHPSQAVDEAATTYAQQWERYGQQWQEYGQTMAQRYATPPSVTPPPPPRVPPVPRWSPRPRRTGILWFWPTLALIAIALGILGIVDGGSTDLHPGVYPATALAITGVMLLVGSFVGRPGGLILIGATSTLLLSVATVLGTFQLDGREIAVAPTTAAAVQDTYTANLGRIELDLTRVADPENLAGRQIELSLDAGEIVVVVPRDVTVRIDAEHTFAGGIRVPGYDGGGFGDSVTRTLVGTSTTALPALDLRLEASVGQITVEQR